MATDDDPYLKRGQAILSGGSDAGSPAPAAPGADPYLAHGQTVLGATGAAPPAPPEETPNWLTEGLGYAAGVAGSVLKGVSFGLDDKLNALTARLPWGDPNQALRTKMASDQAQFEAAHPYVSSGAQIVGSIPTYILGEGALRAVVPVAQGGGLVPTVANLTGSAVRNAAVSGAEAAGEATSEPLAAAQRGASVGAIAGPVADIAGRAVGKVFGGASSVTSGDAALGDLARTKYDIPVTAADLTNNSLYRIANDQLTKLPFSGAAGADAAKRTAWQGAIANEMGEPAAKAFTPDVLTNAKTRIGAGFDAVANRTSIDPASVNTMVGDLGQIMHDAGSTPLPEGTLKTLQKQVDDIVGIAAKGNGTISGQAYQALTRAKAPLDLAESASDPNVRHVAGQIRDALDDAFVRSSSPADQAELAKLKYQYRVMRTVDPLAAGSRDGSISPDAFMQKVLTASRRFDSPTGGVAYTGGGNIGELARIGKLFRAAPQTGTADRTLVNALTLGGAGGLGYLNPYYAAGVPAALAANRAAGSYLRSGALANRLIESSLNPGMVRPPSAAIPAVASGYNALIPP